MAPDSVFGGAVTAHGLMVVDALQCYLDVSSSAARGQEQAQHIFERVLSPHFQELGWS